MSDNIEKTCVVCNEKFTGWGNNPSPVKDEGECCNKCDNEIVIPKRMEQMYGK